MKVIGTIFRFLLVWLVALAVITLLWRTVGFGDLPDDSLWEGIALILISMLVAVLFCMRRGRRSKR